MYVNIQSSHGSYGKGPTVKPPGCFSLFQDHIGLVSKLRAMFVSIRREICRFLSNGMDDKFPQKGSWVFGFSCKISFCFNTICFLPSYTVVSITIRRILFWSVPNMLRKPMFPSNLAWIPRIAIYSHWSLLNSEAPFLAESREWKNPSILADCIP